MKLQRRTLLAGAAASIAAPSLARTAIETRDGQTLFAVDKGAGQPVVFIHGWTLSSAIWSAQTDWSPAMACVPSRTIGAATGSRASRRAATTTTCWSPISPPCSSDSISRGAAEVVRYLAHHGTSRVSRVMLVAPTTPYALKTDDNPQGIDRAVYDKFVAALQADRAAYLASGGRNFLGRDPDPRLVDWASRSRCWRSRRLRSAACAPFPRPTSGPTSRR